VAQRRLAKLGAALGDGLLDNTGTADVAVNEHGIVDEPTTIPPTEEPAEPTGPVRTTVVANDGAWLASDLAPEEAAAVAQQKADLLGEAVWLVDPTDPNDKGEAFIPKPKREPKRTARRKNLEAEAPAPEPVTEKPKRKKKAGPTLAPPVEEATAPEPPRVEKVKRKAKVKREPTAADLADETRVPSRKRNERSDFVPEGFNPKAFRVCPCCGQKKQLMGGYGFRRMKDKVAKDGTRTPVYRTQTWCRTCKNQATQIYKISKVDQLRDLLSDPTPSVGPVAARRLAQLEGTKPDASA
jgi:hypothetical protein